MAVLVIAASQLNADFAGPQCFALHRGFMVDREALGQVFL
jgi:hypothetical protein